MLSSDRDDISISAWANSASRHRRSIVALGLALGLAVGGSNLLGPRAYTSEVWFRPQTQDPTGGSLAGVAARFGVPVASRNTDQSADFFATLLKTKSILGSAVDTRYQLASAAGGRSDPTGRNLMQLFEIPEGPPDRRRELAIRALQNATTTTVERETNLVKLGVTTSSPELSVMVAQRLVELVNEFNVESARTRAAAQRVFTEEQLDQARLSLRHAEDNQQSFREHNRDFQTSLPLQFEDARLGREVDQRQQVLISLAQAYDQSRLDEVRTMPVIAVVEQPTTPVFPNSRHVVSKTLLGCIGGASLGMLLALVRDFRQNPTGQRADVGDVVDTGSHDLRAIRDLAATPFRLLFRRIPPRQAS